MSGNDESLSECRMGLLMMKFSSWQTFLISLSKSLANARHTQAQRHTQAHKDTHTSTFTHTGRGTWLLIKTPLMQLGIWLEQ